MNEQTFSLSVPADARYLKSIRAFFQSVLVETCGDATDMLVLALDESCSNILKHRPRGVDQDLLQVDAELQPGRVRFRVKDFCCPADVPHIKPRDLKVVRPGGLGTHYIGRIMDRVEFEPDPERAGRMVLVLEKAIPAAEGGGKRGR